MGVPIIQFPDGVTGCYPNQIQYSDWVSPGSLRVFYGFDQVKPGIWEFETSPDLVTWTTTRQAKSHKDKPSCVTFDVAPEEGFGRIRSITIERFMELMK